MCTMVQFNIDLAAQVLLAISNILSEVRILLWFPLLISKNT